MSMAPEQATDEIERLIDTSTDTIMAVVAMSASWAKLMIRNPFGYSAVQEAAELLKRGQSQGQHRSD